MITCQIQKVVHCMIWKTVTIRTYPLYVHCLKWFQTSKLILLCGFFDINLVLYN
jgi:hypothetical protein